MNQAIDRQQRLNQAILDAMTVQRNEALNRIAFLQAELNVTIAERDEALAALPKDAADSDTPA